MPQFSHFVSLPSSLCLFFPLLLTSAESQAGIFLRWDPMSRHTYVRHGQQVLAEQVVELSWMQDWKLIAQVRPVELHTPQVEGEGKVKVTRRE